MGLPDVVAIKLSVYTLFCRRLLEHLTELNDATRDDPRLPPEECIRRFDDELHKFFREAKPASLEQAVGELGSGLSGRVTYIRAQNPQAATVFDQVIEKATAVASAWRYQEDLEAFHQQGRELARRFYAGSPWPVTQARLDRKARLLFCDDEPVVPQEETFGYHPTPVAFYERYEEPTTGQKLTNVILVRFGFNYDFGLYLAYPYLFMHEYVAHIFALDYNNERFNDGWLLHAADAFLWWWWSLDLEPRFTREQINAFKEHLYSRLDRIPRKSCCFARDFDAWLNNPQRFQAITWELAAFEPRPGESPFWPNQFINRLAQEFDHDRPRLKDKIRSARDLRSLFEALAPA